jgi:anti-sigma B factor antagonist
MKLFLLTRLALAFEFFEDEQDAVNSFFPDRALKHFDVLEFVENESGREPNSGGKQASRLLE